MCNNKFCAWKIIKGSESPWFRKRTDKKIIRKARAFFIQFGHFIKKQVCLSHFDRFDLDLYIFKGFLLWNWSLLWVIMTPIYNNRDSIFGTFTNESYIKHIKEMEKMIWLVQSEMLYPWNLTKVFSHCLICRVLSVMWFLLVFPL